MDQREWDGTAMERELVKHGVIASMSFGAERKFAFKHIRTKQTVSIFLQSGSLLTMENQTQDHWQHRLPPTKGNYASYKFDISSNEIIKIDNFLLKQLI